jgi:hypothetical protein
MLSTDGFIVRPTHTYWVTLVLALKNYFLSCSKGQEAKNQMDAEKYSGNMKDYIVKMKRSNNLVEMWGVTIRTTIGRQLLKDLQRRILLMSSSYLDYECVQMIFKADKIVKWFLVEEKLLRGY